MRISILTDTFAPDLNGVAVTVGQLVGGLTERGHEIELFCPKRCASAGAREVESNLALSGVPRFPVPKHCGLALAAPQGARLRSRWKERRPDVIYIATEGFLGRSALVTAKQMRIPVASGFHTNAAYYLRQYHLPGFSKILQRYLKSFHNRSDCTLVPTLKLAMQLMGRGYKNVFRLGRGVDTERFSPARRSGWLREQWGAAPEDPVALYVGRIAAEKSLPVALESARALRVSHPGLKMVVVGDGPLLGKLEKCYPEVIWAGPKTGELLAACYASADLFLFPSETETYGNVVAEALASGLVTVAIDGAAASELIISGKNGFLSPPGDGLLFQSVAHRALSLRDRWEKIRASARVAASAASWDAVTQTFEAHLAQIADRRRVDGEARSASRRVEDISLGPIATNHP